jgi:hypothetical protein
MTTFTCTYPELKKVAGDFIRAIPGADLPALDAGLKCVQLHYMGMTASAEHETVGAVAVLKICSDQYIRAEAALQGTF